jgi:hypothetical protein
MSYRYDNFPSGDYDRWKTTEPFDTEEETREASEEMERIELLASMLMCGADPEKLAAEYGQWAVLAAIQLLESRV